MLAFLPTHLFIYSLFVLKYDELYVPIIVIHYCPS